MYITLWTIGYITVLLTLGYITMHDIGITLHRQKYNCILVDVMQF